LIKGMSSGMPCQGRGREFESRFPLQIFSVHASDNIEAISLGFSHKI